jgi:D-beta-D-heptose 7-phosphate kinase/D-beta-D-heptose 1-phosphate adenosyltransferase
MDVRSVIPAETLHEAREAWRRAGKSIVFTNGVFDLLHVGHLALLEDAAAMGDVLVVAINDDASVRRLKGPTRPIYPAQERAEILLALRWVDAVTIFEDDTPLETIRRVRPDVLVKGAEYGTGAIVGEDDVVRGGGRVVRYPMHADYSTTRIVEGMRRTKG